MTKRISRTNIGELLLEGHDKESMYSAHKSNISSTKSVKSSSRRGSIET